MPGIFNSAIFNNAIFNTGSVAPVVPPVTAPSGGYLPTGRIRTPDELRRQREELGIIPAVVTEVATRQAERLETDKQKQFEELEREIRLEGLEWDARYLEALNVTRARLITEEIARRLTERLRQEEEEALTLLVLAASAL